MRVEVRVAGERGPRIEPRVVPPPAAAVVTLRELLVHVVRSEVTAFTDREQQRRFVRALGPDQIAAGAASGRIVSGGRPPTGPVDVGAAVDAAIAAFRDGLYLVLVDEEQVEDLDATLTLRQDTRLRFVRLTPLAGG